MSKGAFSRVAETGVLGILDAGVGLAPVYQARRHQQGHPHLMSSRIYLLMPPRYASSNYRSV